MSGTEDGSSETIYALASGAVPAGIAVVRISGPATRFVLETMTGSRPSPRRASLRRLRDRSGDVLDVGLVLWFPGPESFTGEDMAELHLHGGRAVVAAVLRFLADHGGLRPAEAGEFTRRAFLAGRMDLTEVEGLADLIASETEWQRRQALRQQGGALRRLYEGWRADIVRIRAWVEADLDFADEADVPGSVAQAALVEADRLARAIEAHLADGRRGERLRSGFEVVLMGAPNAGKSSLLNALARRDAAIVTAEPGTTRDLIEVHLDIDGYPVTLVDAAGLRPAEGAVEAEGIRRAVARAAAADLVLWLEPADGWALPAMPAAINADRVVVVRSKADLGSGDPSRAGLAVSAVSGAGLADLVAEIGRRAACALAPGDEPAVTRERHRIALAETLAALRSAGKLGTPLELVAEDLRTAGNAVGRITGAVGVEDVLDVIFSSFCIGK